VPVVRGAGPADAGGSVVLALCRPAMEVFRCGEREGLPGARSAVREMDLVVGPVVGGTLNGGLRQRPSRRDGIEVGAAQRDIRLVVHDRKLTRAMRDLRRIESVTWCGHVLTQRSPTRPGNDLTTRRLGVG
jgi:hypothetical protein